MCPYPGCGALVERGYCDAHTKDKVYHDQHWRAWYKTARWARLRKRILSDHPLCECERCQGKQPIAAMVVDHIRAHRGNEALFWDPNNLRAMSKEHHDAKTNAEIRDRTIR